MSATFLAGAAGALAPTATIQPFCGFIEAT
jgi:hypothetical protein